MAHVELDDGLWRVEYGTDGALYQLRPDAERYLRERQAGRTHEQAVVIVAEAWWREGAD